MKSYSFVFTKVVFQLLIVVTGMFILFLYSCKDPKDKKNINYQSMSWAEIESRARGTTATMIMYMGAKNGNRYMNEYIIPEVKKRYNITLKLIPGQGKEIISGIMSEKEAGEEKGLADICWINGETFYQLRQIDGLYGPYNNMLPNFSKVDTANPIINYDFQEPINGYETPWSLANFSLVYDSARTPVPPVTMEEFEQYWKAHSGKFTIPTDFNGSTLLKSWLIELAGGSKELDGKFDDVKYKKYSAALWNFLNRNKKNFWKNGETFPASNTVVMQMFASGELDFSFSFANADIDTKISEGFFPATSRPLILRAGSIQNTSYLGIPFNSSNKGAAFVIINFLISPEAQAAKASLKFTGSRTVLRSADLSVSESALFDSVARIEYAIPASVLAQKAIREPVPEYMIRVSEDFRKLVIEAN